MAASASDYLVNGCLLKCDKCYMAGQEGYDDYTVLINSENDVAVGANGQPMMNDLDTALGGNFIRKFDFCKAPDYVKRLGEIMEMLQNRTQVGVAGMSQEDRDYCNEKLMVYRPTYNNLLSLREPIAPTNKPCFFEVLNNWYESDVRFSSNHEYEAMEAVSSQFENLISVCEDICEKAIGAIKDLKTKNKALYDSNSYEIIQALENAKEIALKVAKPFRSLEVQYNEQAYLYNDGDELVEKLGSIAAELEAQISEKVLRWNVEYHFQSMLNNATNKYKFKSGLAIDNLRGTVQFSCIQEVGVMTKAEFEYIFGSRYNDEINALIQKINVLKMKLINGEVEAHQLTEKSFLICRFGGTITFFKTGQWLMEVADRILPNFREMLQAIIADATKTIDEENAYYSTHKEVIKYDFGVDQYYKENGDVLSAVIGAAKALWEMTYSESGKIPKEYDCPAFARIRFYPQNYIKETEDRVDAVLGAAMLAPLVLPGSAAVVTVGSGITLLLFIKDLLEGEFGFSQGVTVANTGLDAVNQAFEKGGDSAWRKSTVGGVVDKASGAVSFLDAAIGAVGLLSSIYSLVHGSDEYYLGQIVVELITPKASYSYKQNYDFLGSKIGKMESMRISAKYYDEQRCMDSLESDFYIDDEQMKSLYKDVPLCYDFREEK